MSAENEVPILMQFMFGETAALARQTASERLLRWCQAMDDWLGERRRLNHRSTYKTSINAWKQLLSGCAKPPWEITPVDIEAHIEDLQEGGYAPNTIGRRLSMLSAFYIWCSQQGVDPACGKVFNPVAGVPRPKVRRYVNVKMLSRAEVNALLAILKRDESNLGRRDYAFFLARLSMGVKLETLQQLQWGQIKQDETGLWLQWEADQERVPCPPEVWGAVREYLEASGRMEGIRPQAYIFAPLQDMFKREASGQPQAWNEGRYLSSKTIKKNLRIYGRLAGIPDEKLTLRGLRHTAVLLRQEAGDSVQGIHAFLGTKLQLNDTKRYLRQLPPLPADIIRPGDENRPQDQKRSSGEVQEPPPLPDRKPRFFESEDSFIHGYYAMSLPTEEVLAMLAEDIQGMEEEIIGLRILSRALLERQNEVVTGNEMALLSNAYTQAADRLRVMIKAAEQLEEPNEDDDWAEAILTMVDNKAVEMGGEPFSEEVRQEVLGSNPEMLAGSRRLTEEIGKSD